MAQRKRRGGIRMPGPLFTDLGKMDEPSIFDMSADNDEFKTFAGTIVQKQSLTSAQDPSRIQEGLEIMRDLIKSKRKGELIKAWTLLKLNMMVKQEVASHVENLYQQRGL